MKTRERFMPILHWLNRDKNIRAMEQVSYRLLEPQDEYSFGDADTQNMLIQGDNLDALKALLPYYAGQVKCICIDPPYNTRSAFEHYDDNLEHSQWLSMMYPRIELLRDLLAEDGSIWVTIDDNEAHYLKVIMDEVFGRKNFVDTIIWRKNYSPKSSAKHFSSDHDYILVYAKNADSWRPKLIPRGEKQNKAYKNPDNDSRGPWKTSDLSARNFYSLGKYEIQCPGGRIIPGPPGGNYWRVSEEKFWERNKDNRIWWGRDGNAIPQIKRFLSEVKEGVTPQTYWHYDEVGHTQEAKKEILQLFGSDVFLTPKPERLLERIVYLSSSKNDIILDSFLGSGTAAAVAHKMGRRYIGIEMGEHAKTHCVTRLKKVIEGEQGGISKNVNWQGGGGYRFYQLGSTVFDSEGRINPEISFSHLAAHIWFSETRIALHGEARNPYLGTRNGTAYYLLYNGILGDKRPDGGNVLTSKVLSYLPSHDGPKVIYGETSRLGQARLKSLNIIFKQTPYDVKVG